MGDGPAVPVDASTVLLLRDGPEGIEVFLMERHAKGAFAGLLVFPGGKVDDTDRDLPDDRWTGIDLGAAAERLSVDDQRQARGFLVAAARETFEEAGVLLATRAGSPVTASDLEEDSFVRARGRLNVRGQKWDWTQWLRDEDLVLDLGALGLWSWWVTPEVEMHRFDTRFFAAQMPAAQSSMIGHDNVEAVASGWRTPAQAIAERDAGTSIVIFPTRRTLEAIAEFDTADAAVSAALAGKTDTRRVQPTGWVDDDGALWVQHPYEDEPAPAL